jgi:cell wall-associated NlpC family hydrolase
LLTAGALCPTISPAIVAAQVMVASGWNPAAQTTAGAQGLAQMTPTAWATWGRDDDGKGNASPLDGPNALMALGRQDCALVPVISPLAAGGVSALSLTLAAVKAGSDAVLTARGVPAAPDVAAYVSDVLGLAASYVSPPASALGTGIVAAAQSALGTPYLWGGGTSAGPSGGSPAGFDCSGLVLWAVWQASGGKLNFPHSSELQATMGQAIDPSALQAGDVIAYQLHDPGDFDHIVIYVGAGQVIAAPDTGDVVKVQSLTDFGTAASTVRRYSLP